MSKFKESNRVKVTNGRYKGEVGVVVEVVEPSHGNEGYYIIQSRVGSPKMEVTESCLIEYPTSNYNYEDHIRDTKIVEYYKTGKTFPELLVGDVVELKESGNERYVVDEVITVKGASFDSYKYSIFPIDKLDNYDESKSTSVYFNKLKWIYNDKNLAEYFNESVGNGLPAWRGELYNFTKFMVYPESNSVNSIKDEEIKKYISENKPMIRPYEMQHILGRHSICYRMASTILMSKGKGYEKAQKIVEMMGDNIQGNYKDYFHAVEKRLISRNSTSLDYKDKIKVKNIPSSKLLNEDFIFADCFDKVDTEMRDGELKPVNHYPIEMTNLQIMDAIREAYKNSKRVGDLEIQFDKKDDLSLPAPHKGKRLYEGYSKSYDLVIQFYYNFDMNIIETGYPVDKSRHKKKWNK